MSRFQHRRHGQHAWIAALISAAIIVFTLAVCAFASAPSAKADWYPGCTVQPGCNVNYGADYFGAACAQGQIVYGIIWGACSGVGFSYSPYGTPGLYQVKAPNALGGLPPILYGFSDNNCPLNTVQTFTGCATEVDQQGCKAQSNAYQSVDENGAGSVGEPCSISNGNVFETATDFTTVGQNPLTSRRYYNSDANYSAPWPTCTTQGAAPNGVHSFYYTRFGYAWRSEYDRFIVPGGVTGMCSTPSTTSSVDAIRADGTPVHFVLSGSTWYVAYWNFSLGEWSFSTDPRHNLNISISTDGTYWYINDADAGNTVDKYNALGQLVSITYRNGYQQTLTYDVNGNNTVVSDSQGRQITFAYLANGLVNSVTDTAGNVTQYSYVDCSSASPPPVSGDTGLWALQTVTYPDTTSITYGYTDPNLVNRFALTSLTDENGHTYSSWTYDSTTGRGTSSQLAGGADETQISYNDTAVTRTVTNALGKQVVYSLASFQGILQINNEAWQASTNTPASTVSYTYDSNGYMQQKTSGESRITEYTHNSIGQETSRTDGYTSPVARTISTTWDATYNLPDQIVAPNITYNFTYTSGLLTQLTETDTTTQSVPYSTNGETRTWNYTYYSTGLLDTVEGPLGVGDTVTYAYNTNGFVNTITDQLGHVTTITAWNVWGEPLTSVDPNGVTTNYTYDLRARLKSVTVNPGAAQAVTSFGYDNAGNLTSITLPDSSSLTYGYDMAHRLTSVTNNLGESITYTLDAMGDRTATVVKNASSTITKTQTAAFDELARLLKSIGASSQTTTYGYDKDNNEVSVTDPRSKLYQYAYDAIERVMQETDPDSKTTGLTYNGNDQVTGVTDARSLATSYVRDGFGDIIQQTSPDTGTTKFWFDVHGNITKKVDARSIETDMTYDATNRILTKTFPADTAEDVTYSYDSTTGGNDGVGRLTGVTDQSGTTSFVYNALGQIVTDSRKIAANTYGAAYTFDPAGHPLTITYPSGRIVTYTRDALGRVSGITTKQNSGATAVTVLSSATYEPFGGFAGASFGNGVSLTIGYDQDYELTSINAAAGSAGIQNLSYGYDPSSNITSVTDSLATSRSQTLAYDDLNRLWCATGAYGTQAYTYDGVGNRASLSAGGTIGTCPSMSGGTTSTYATSATANQISTITTGSAVRTFGYLASGQVNGDQRTATSDYTFGYNNDGRLTSASLNSSTVGAYIYNGFEQRVKKTVGSTVTDFVYDRFGHLLAEANDATGAAVREYIWMNDVPVAMIDDTGASPVVYYIHTDQLGTPQKMTDANANVVWDGLTDPFGNTLYTGANWGTGIWGDFTWEPTTPEAMPLRFPGQYADTETALNQNWFRDYDPTIGRYIESDPIGLLGGVNTYAYVGENPLVRTDQFGLCPKECPPESAVEAANDAIALGTGAGLIGAAIDAAAAGLVVAGGGPEDPVTDAGAYATASAGSSISRAGGAAAFAGQVFLSENGEPREALNAAAEYLFDKTVGAIVPDNLQPVTDQALDSLINNIEDLAGVPKNTCIPRLRGATLQ